MAMVRYNSRLSPVFRSLWDDQFLAPFFGRSETGWSPSMDVFEKDGVLVLEAELPGVGKNDVKITCENGVLTLRGERKSEEVKEGTRHYARERWFGEFSRAFRIGGSYDAKKVDARFRDGILTITVPKREETLPVEIKIN
ncbi:MAG: Hsp20/alpha crystallin family protein [Deltaproteobacteria bacterium]|nr:Hsp20/alpha crystallin family protein [Deltaproteobacteria bacterium]